MRGVVATNALELGIDIGRLDAAILAGHPGTIASARQQMGRAGRRQGASVAVLVAGGGPLDQYIIAHPRWLLEQSPEHARINPDNEVLLAGHLACAAAELPLRQGEAFGGEHAGSAAGRPGGSGAAVPVGRALLLGGRRQPQPGAEPAERGQRPGGDPGARRGRQAMVIGELDREGVPLLLYEGAIYLHEGASYVVERLDWEAGRGLRAGDGRRLLHPAGDRREDRRTGDPRVGRRGGGALLPRVGRRAGHVAGHELQDHAPRLKRGDRVRPDRPAGADAGYPGVPGWRSRSTPSRRSRPRARGCRTPTTTARSGRRRATRCGSATATAARAAGRSRWRGASTTSTTRSRSGRLSRTRRGGRGSPPRWPGRWRTGWTTS